MESNADSNLKQNNDINVPNEEACGSSTVKDSFDLKDCKNSLPKTTDEKPESGDESDDEFSDADEELDMDEEAIAENHKNLSEEEIQKLKEEAITLKNSGNESFKKGDFKEAITFYTKAMNTCPLIYPSDRSILYANRAASRISIDKKEEAILDCNKAIELNPQYLKAILRRAQIHRKMDSLEKSLEDYQKVLELDQSNAEARQACATLPAEITEKNEKLKTEMFGKLKELGNMCLKPFGMSTDNFKVVQDPNSGGYSINFQQNPS
ncbi:hypothetical protein JTE90_023278 [Oedothorax gibbosus]|uniref:Tetratricopeptide repeat protein 1 n=1 Tax=Oedothorax gibbosus TaxID=931172 RepID=A0AAV6UPN9_9ARAC|nr:hypothetical protein JTE90_023278 [Oedothorax gibbosus]